MLAGFPSSSVYIHDYWTDVIMSRAVSLQGRCVESSGKHVDLSESELSFVLLQLARDEEGASTVHDGVEYSFIGG